MVANPIPLLQALTSIREPIVIIAIILRDDKQRTSNSAAAKNQKHTFCGKSFHTAFNLGSVCISQARLRRSSSTMVIPPQLLPFELLLMHLFPNGVFFFSVSSQLPVDALDGRSNVPQAVPSLHTTTESETGWSAHHRLNNASFGLHVQNGKISCAAFSLRCCTWATSFWSCFTVLNELLWSLLQIFFRYSGQQIPVEVEDVKNFSFLFYWSLQMQFETVTATLSPILIDSEVSANKDFRWKRYKNE